LEEKKPMKKGKRNKLCGTQELSPFQDLLELELGSLAPRPRMG